jgi:hypothetical protein
MSLAYEDICDALHINDDIRARETIAVNVIELARRGERCPTVLRDRVLACSIARLENSYTNPMALKERQSRKIRELREALVAVGCDSLDKQAAMLGLSRSTAWTVLRGNHKASGLSATIINRMLTSPRLPSVVRDRIMEYIEEKVAGIYGHSPARCHKFLGRLAAESQKIPTQFNGSSTSPLGSRELFR